MTLQGAIVKVKKVAQGEWRFNEHDYQDLVRFLEKLKEKQDEEVRAFEKRFREYKYFTFTYHWHKGYFTGLDGDRGTETRTYVGASILDAINQYTEEILRNGYNSAIIDYAIEK